MGRLASIKEFFFNSPDQNGDMPEISIGDRFVNNANQKMVWVVDRIHEKTPHQLPLISLVREGHPDLKKVISQAALGTDSEFHRCS